MLAVAAERNDPNGQSINAGHVWVYTWINNAWTRLGSDIDGEAAGDKSGRGAISLSSDGMVLAVGAPWNDPTSGLTNAGHVRVYTFINNAWTRLGSGIDGEAAGDEFGSWVSLSSNGMVLAVGAPFNDPSSGLANAGHVQVYQYANNLWTQRGNEINGLV